jgi:hypothetical protein
MMAAMMPVMATMMTSMMTSVMTSMMTSMVASAVATVTTVTTTREGLARNGKGSSCQRQSGDSGRHDLLDPGHKHLLGCAARGSLCDDPT